MRPRSWLALGVLLALSLGLGGSISPVTRMVAAQGDQPLVLLSGLQLPDSVRYSVAITKPTVMTLRDVRVEVTLPPGADLVTALETPGFTEFKGLANGVLTWTAPDYPAGEYVDAFSFVLKAAPSEDFGVKVTWAGDPPGQVIFSGRPPVAVARGGAGELVLGPQGTNGTFVPVGDTGVLIGAAADVLPEGTTVRVRPLGPEANPPPSVGDLWWCAMVEVSGLPDGAWLIALVPTRQPLPPNGWLTQFAQEDGNWVELPDKAAVTFDGQYVAFIHEGGILAAGGGGPTSGLNIQPRPAGATNTRAVTGAVAAGTPTAGTANTSNVGLASGAATNAGALNSGAINAARNPGTNSRLGVPNTVGVAVAQVEATVNSLTALAQTGAVNSDLAQNVANCAADQPSHLGFCGSQIPGWSSGGINTGGGGGSSGGTNPSGGDGGSSGGTNPSGGGGGGHRGGHRGGGSGGSGGGGGGGDPCPDGRCIKCSPFDPGCTPISLPQITAPVSSGAFDVASQVNTASQVNIVTH